MAHDTLPSAAVQDLADGLAGTLVQPDDAAYDEARMVWNGMFDRRPALIARCSGAADVIAAVDFAREQGLAVAVRGGGHSAAGYGTCDDGLVIDLSPMKAHPRRPGQRRDRARRGRPHVGRVRRARPRRSGWPSPAGASRRPASPG